MRSWDQKNKSTTLYGDNWASTWFSLFCRVIYYLWIWIQLVSVFRCQCFGNTYRFLDQKRVELAISQQRISTYCQNIQKNYSSGQILLYFSHIRLLKISSWLGSNAPRLCPFGESQWRLYLTRMATPVMRAAVGSNNFAWSKHFGKENFGRPWGISPTWKILRTSQWLQTLNKYAASVKNLTSEMEGEWNTFAIVVPRASPVRGPAARMNWSSLFAFPCHGTSWLSIIKVVRKSTN